MDPGKKNKQDQLLLSNSLLFRKVDIQTSQWSGYPGNTGKGVLPQPGRRASWKEDTFGEEVGKDNYCRK